MRIRVLAWFGLSILALAPVAFAHHSCAYFDQTKEVTYDGVLRDYQWENPHTHSIVKVPASIADPGTLGSWDIEGGSINIMRRQGWGKTLSKGSDQVKIVAHPMKDGAQGASLF